MLLLVLGGALLRGAGAHPPQVVDSDDPGVQKAASYLADHLEGGLGFKVELHSVVEAQRQLVNGMNYDLVVILRSAEGDGLLTQTPVNLPDLEQVRIYATPPWVNASTPYELSAQNRALPELRASSEADPAGVAAAKNCTGAGAEGGGVLTAHDSWVQRVEVQYIALGGAGSNGTYELSSFIFAYTEGGLEKRELVSVLRSETGDGAGYTCVERRVLDSYVGLAFAEMPAEGSSGASRSAIATSVSVFLCLLSLGALSYGGFKLYQTRYGKARNTEGEYARALELDDL